MKVWFFVLGLILTSCSTVEREKLRFLFITTCVEEGFFRPVKKGMDDAAREMGVEATFTGTHGVDVPRQAAMVRQAVKDGYDGVALNLIDPEGFDEVVQEAVDAGVPVVAFNVDDHATHNARLSAVCQDLYEAGKTLGRKSLEFIPSGSKILMTMHAEGVSALEDRLHGAQEVLKEKGITWEVVITGNLVEASAKVILEALAANPEIKHVLCTGQADTEGAALAIERRFNGYAAAGFDLSPGILKAVKAGHVRFTIDQQPYVQGYYPVVQLALYCRYGIMPYDMDAGAGIITADQVDSVLRLSEKGYR